MQLRFPRKRGNQATYHGSQQRKKPRIINILPPLQTVSEGWFVWDGNERVDKKEVVIDEQLQDWEWTYRFRREDVMLSERGQRLSRMGGMGGGRGN